MGNSQTKSLQQLGHSNKNKKGFSFDIGDFNSYNLQKLKPSQGIITANNKHQKSSILTSQSLQKADKQPQLNIPQLPKSMNRQSSQVISSKARNKLQLKQQNARLQRLNRSNDELRKQLMEINEKLALELQKKKAVGANNKNGSNERIENKYIRKGHPKSNRSFSQPKADQQKYLIKQNNDHKSNNSNNKFRTIALKKELQNAYSQVNNYKKQIELLKKNTSTDNNIKLAQFEDKLKLIDNEITTVQKSIHSIKQIVTKQSQAIEQEEQKIVGGGEIEGIKLEIAEMKQRLKQIKQIGRKKEKEEKLRHQLQIQLERKLREINGQYLPEFKSYGQIVQQNQQRLGRESRITLQQSSSQSQQKSRINANRLGMKQRSPQQQRGQFTLDHQRQQQVQPPLKQPTLEQVQLILAAHRDAKLKYQEIQRTLQLQRRRKKQLIELRQTIQQRISLQLQKQIQQLKYKKQRYMKELSVTQIQTG